MQTKIRILVLPVLALALLAACGGGTAHDQLVGSWGIDTDALRQIDGYDAMDDASRQQIEGMFANMTMTFTKDTVKMEGVMGMPANEEGYRVVKEEGNRLVLEKTEGQGKGDQVTIVVDGDTLRFEAEEMPIALAFKRK